MIVFVETASTTRASCSLRGTLPTSSSASSARPRCHSRRRSREPSSHPTRRYASPPRSRRSMAPSSARRSRSSRTSPSGTFPSSTGQTCFPVVPSVVCVTRFTDIELLRYVRLRELARHPHLHSVRQRQQLQSSRDLWCGADLPTGDSRLLGAVLGGSLAWTLAGSTVTATYGTTPICTPDDYPPGDSPIPTDVIDPDSPKELSPEARLLDLPDRGPDRPPTSQPQPSDGGNPPDPLPPIVPCFPKAISRSASRTGKSARTTTRPDSERT